MVEARFELEQLDFRGLDVIHYFILIFLSCLSSSQTPYSVVYYFREKIEVIRWAFPQISASAFPSYSHLALPLSLPFLQYQRMSCLLIKAISFIFASDLSFILSPMRPCFHLSFVPLFMSQLCINKVRFLISMCVSSPRPPHAPKPERKKKFLVIHLPLALMQ